MQKSIPFNIRVAALGAFLALAACGGGGGSSLPPATPTFSIGGTVSGLMGTGLVLQNNGGNNLAVAADSPFSFSGMLTSGTAYAVAVGTQPSNPTQTCIVANGSGVVAGANVSNVTVTCTTNSYSIGGTVSGLAGSGLVLVNNGGDNQTVTANGTVSFATPIISGGAYDIRVFAQPASPNQRCTITNGTGIVGGAAVSATINCVTQVPRFAYSLDWNDASVSVYGVDVATGQLRPRGYVRVGANPIDGAGDGTGKFSYILSQGAATISSFAHDDVTGSFQELSNSPLSTGAPSGSSNRLTVHPSGRFVYATNGGAANTIVGFAIDANSGVLSPVPGSPFTTGANPHKLTFSLNGAFAYVVNRDSDTVYTYSVNQTAGTLTEVPGSRVSVGTSPVHLLMHASGRFAYVTNSRGGSISAFQVNASTGVLTPVIGSPFAAGVNPEEIATLHPNGKYLYVRNVGATDTNGSVSAFSINLTNGALNAIGSPLAIGSNSTHSWIDGAGRFLFIANHGPSTQTGASSNGSISMFRIDATTGALTTLAGISSLQPAPRTVSTDPSGNFVYVASAEGNLLYSYALNGTSGALTPLTRGAKIVGRAAPISLFAYPSVSTPSAAVFRSKFAYASNGGTGAISAYTAHVTSGALTPVSGTFEAGVIPLALAAHPNGKFLLSTDLVPPTKLIPHAIHPTTGALTAATTFPTVGSSPIAVTVEPSGRFVYTAHNTDSTIAIHAIDPSAGTLTVVGTPVPTILGSLVDIAISPSGRFLYAVSDTSFGWWSIDAATGALSSISGTTVGGGFTIKNVVIDPNGRYLYISTGAGNSIKRYTLNPYTGAPTLDDTFLISGIGALAIDPTGRFMYTANGTANNVSAFSIDQSTGVLTQLAGSPFPMGINAVPAIATDYSGKFVYVLISGPTPVVGAYTIGASGGLSLIGDVATGLTPNRIVVTNDMQ